MRWALIFLATAGACASAPGPSTPPPRSTPPRRVASAASAVSAAETAPPPEPVDEAAPPPDKPRLFVQGYFVYVWPKPSADGRYIGALRVGTSVTLHATDLVKGDKCGGGFYAIEPRGYVCNSSKVTREPSERLLALAAAVASSAGELPYRYALSNGAPMYSRVPTEKEQQKKERKYGPA